MRLAGRLAAAGAVLAIPSLAWAGGPPLPLAPTGALQMALLLGAASLIPAIVLTCTCFTRFIIVFSFLRTGLGTQGAPPNQVLVGLALFMTMFVMAPVAQALRTDAISPYLAGKLDEEQALEAATPALRTFLLSHTRRNDLALFYDVSRSARPRTADDVPLRIAVPAFVLSELRTAFEMGLVVLLPFLVIDLLVASVLSSLGMAMVPPVAVSMPVKLLVFVTVDGWHLLVESLLRGMA